MPVPKPLPIEFMVFTIVGELWVLIKSPKGFTQSKNFSPSYFLGHNIHLIFSSRDNLTRFGLLPEALSPVLTRLAKLMLSHPHEDVRTKARNVLNLIKGQ